MRKLTVGIVAFGVVALGACSSSTPKAAPSTAPSSSAPTSTGSTSSTRSRTTASTTPPAPDLAALHLQLQTVVSGLSSPVAIAFRRSAADPRGVMYVAEQTGLLRRIVDGRASATPALDLRANLTHGNEQGFLGAAFSPDGQRLYVDYTDAAGNTNVDEYAMRGANAVVSTRRRVLFVEQPYPNHNGGEVIFGPDGDLYIGLGDGGAAGDPFDHGQDL